MTKATQLKTWQNDNIEVMITNNTLETEMNVDKVVLMIHVNVTWDCITFSQEFERAECEEKNVYSMTFIDKAEMRELKKLNSRYQMMNDAALSEFLMVKECR